MAACSPASKHADELVEESSGESPTLLGHARKSSGYLKQSFAELESCAEDDDDLGVLFTAVKSGESASSGVGLEHSNTQVSSSSRLSRLKKRASTEDSNYIERNLSKGQRALRKIRMRISGTVMGLGLLCVAACWWILLLDSPVEERFVWQAHLFSAAFGLLRVLALTLIALAPLRDDRPLTRVLLSLLILNTLATGLVIAFDIQETWIAVEQGICWLGGEESPLMACRGWLLVAVFRDVIKVFVVVGFIWALFADSNAAKMQEKMWDVIAWATIVGLMVSSAKVLMQAVVLHRLSPAIWELPEEAFAIYVARSPSFRIRLLSWVASLYELHGKTAAAAGIAGLVGDCSTKEVMACARAKFRSVRLSHLKLQDFQGHDPSVPPTDQTEPTRLGECEAFLSHSWHDDPEAKWRSLQTWRKDFVSRKGYEPRVWFDRCCIDQSRIEEDLRCLPVFLSGCKELIVLCGSTYLSRLWCIMELFTYVHTGGDTSRIRLIPLIRDGHEREDAEAIVEAFREFDASHCACFDEGDKEAMLTVIHSSFGHMSKFNVAVNAILRQARSDDLGLDLLSLDSSSGSGNGSP